MKLVENGIDIPNKLLKAHKDGGIVFFCGAGVSQNTAKKPDFIQLAKNHSAKEYVNGMAHTNSIESVWAVLKRGYNGTFHNISTKHLQRYVDEFVFRLNEGNCQIDTKDRMVSLFKGIGNNRISYKKLVNT
jgi:hypothetical protein